MSVGHSHDGPDPLRLAAWPRAVVLGLIAVTGVLAVLGVVHWWPDASRVDHARGISPAMAPGVTVVHAELRRVRTACVTTGASAGPGCADSTARVLDGADSGRQVTVALAPDVIGTGLGAGDHVLLLRNPPVAGRAASFAFYRDDRGPSLLWFAVLFALLVGVVAWRRGVMAIVGLAFSALAVGSFLLPALLSGQPPVPVTIAAAVLILIVTLYATHGISMRTSVALLGALVGVGLSTAFAWIGVLGTRLGGLGDDAAELLTTTVPWIAVQQLVIASVILAGLGTLNDVTVTQVSALWELREASPAMSRRALFASAMRIGRDHVASTVYTIVFAYLGTALVLLVAVQLYGGTPVSFLTAEDVAEEVVRTLVGGIALVLAMPVTTLIGTLVVAGATPGDGQHGDPDDDPYAAWRAEQAARGGSRRWSPEPTRPARRH